MVWAFLWRSGAIALHTREAPALVPAGILTWLGKLVGVSPSMTWRLVARKCHAGRL